MVTFVGSTSTTFSIKLRFYVARFFFHSFNFISSFIQWRVTGILHKCSTPSQCFTLTLNMSLLSCISFPPLNKSDLPPSFFPSCPLAEMPYRPADCLFRTCFVNYRSKFINSIPPTRSESQDPLKNWPCTTVDTKGKQKFVLIVSESLLII